MFKITPPRSANSNLDHSQSSCNVSGGAHFFACRLFLFIVLILCAGLIVFAGYKKGHKVAEPLPAPEEGNPVYISKTLFHSCDSVMYYYERGLVHNDPKGLFVIGVAAHLRQDGTLPDIIYAPSVAEGDSCLLLSANLGYRDAIQAVYCLHKHGCWNLDLPTPRK